MLAGPGNSEPHKVHGPSGREPRMRVHLIEVVVNHASDIDPRPVYQPPETPGKTAVICGEGVCLNRHELRSRGRAHIDDELSQQLPRAIWKPLDPKRSWRSLYPAGHVLVLEIASGQRGGALWGLGSNKRYSVNCPRAAIYLTCAPSVLATRKPKKRAPTRAVGPRSAERRPSGSRPQLPPRTTRRLQSPPRVHEVPLGGAWA